MKNFIKNLSFSIFILMIALAAGCSGSGNNGSDANQSQDQDNVKVQDSTAQKEDPNQFSWSVIIDDSSSVAIGQVQSTTFIKLIANNDSKGIKGHYTGLGSGKTLNSNLAYGSQSQAGVENTLAFDFTIGDTLAPLVPQNSQDDNDDLAPLVPQQDDDFLAPLVPNDDALASLAETAFKIASLILRPNPVL